MFYVDIDFIYLIEIKFSLIFLFIISIYIFVFKIDWLNIMPHERKKYNVIESYKLQPTC